MAPTGDGRTFIGCHVEVNWLLAMRNGILKSREQIRQRAGTMRIILLVGALTLAMSGAANAQMCGAGMQGQTTAQGGGMMGCMGMMRTQAQTDDPMADKPAAKQPQQQQAGMCPCCQNMAMMGKQQGGQQGGGMQQHDMTPKQQ